jgi:tetratricopeptide (TPR) repeat protein
MMKRAAVVLMVVVCALVTAQTRPADPDTVSRAEVVLAARQALETASRNLGRWLTTVIVAVLVAAMIAVWRIWALSRQVARLEDLHAAWETRFAGTADEVLRLKRKLADSESRADKLEADMASLHPAEPDAATAQVAMVQSELVAVRERLDRAEESLEAVADHTVVAKQERAVVEDLVKIAVQAQGAAEAAAVRAEAVAKRAAAVDSLRAGDEKLAQQQYPAAVQAYVLCLESLAGSPSDESGLRFHALHNRALANLRQREFGKVLVDAAEIEGVASARSDGGEATGAQGAARLLAGVAHLWQGDVAQALKDFARAIGQDPAARAVILQDEDIAIWVKVNPKRAGPVKRFIREQGRKSKQHRRPW